MDQGSIRLHVGWNGERIVTASAKSRRPQASLLLVGRPVTEAVALAPRLFSLCGCAQGAAARLAAASSLGEAPPLEELTRTVVLEAIGEHLWRLLLDWPPLQGLQTEKEVFLRWRKRLLVVKDGPETAAVSADLRDWLAARPPIPVCRDRAMAAPALLMPWCRADDWAAVAIDEDFARSPLLGDQPAETGALARQAEVPEVSGLLLENWRVAARIAARWAELEFLARGLLEPDLLRGWLGAAQVAPGIGLARVETARGLLLHLMQVKDDRVARYVIVAPTEWNFYPQGAFAGEIVGSAAATRDEAEGLARRLALALDPCVNFEVAVEEVEDA